MMSYDSDKGFTLVEVLAALTVFSIAALALINLNNETTRSAAYLDLRALADIEAENRMALIWLDNNIPSPGIRTGESEIMGQALEWSEQVSALPGNNLLQIDVRIIEPETQQTLTKLSALKRATP